MPFYRYIFGVEIKVVNIDYIVSANILNVFKEFFIVKTSQSASICCFEAIYNDGNQ